MKVNAKGITATLGRAAARDTLTRRASMTAMASILDYCAKIGVFLLVTPLVVSGLGRTLYGAWEILSRLVNYMGAADGRPGDALRLVVASQQRTADDEQQRRNVGSALTVWLIFMPLVALIGVVITLLSPALTHAAPEYAGETRFATALFVGGFMLTGLAAVPDSALRGMNQGFRQMGLQAGLNILGGVLILLAVVLGLGLPGLAAAHVILALASGIVYVILARRYVPWFGVAKPQRSEVVSMVRTSAWLGVGDLISRVLLASDVIILGVILSPAIVTTYVLTGYAAKTGVGILGFAAHATMPGVGGLIGHGKLDRAWSLRNELLDYTWLFSVAIGGTIILTNESFIRMWVGPENFGGTLVNLLIVVFTMQSALIRSDAYLIDAALRPRLRVVYSALAGATSVALGIVGTKMMGVPGLCMGLVAGRAIQTVAFPLIVRSLLEERGAASTADRSVGRRRAIRRVLATVVLLGGAVMMSLRVAPDNWIMWVAFTATSLPVLVAVAFFLGFDAERRRSARVRFAALLGIGPAGEE